MLGWSACAAFAIFAYGRAAESVAIAGTAVALIVSLVPFWMGMTGWIYLLPAALLGAAFLATGVVFARRRSEKTART